MPGEPCDAVRKFRIATVPAVKTRLIMRGGDFSGPSCPSVDSEGALNAT